MQYVARRKSLSMAACGAAATLKAVALGARGVLLGRAPLYGLASRGAAGASEVLALMMEEMLISLRLLGCQGIGDLGPACVARDGSHGADLV